MLVCVLTFGATASASTVVSADTLDNFFDDFESYSVTGNPVETDSTIKQVWENNVLKDGDPVNMDSHIFDVAKIAYENGQSGNKVMALNNTGAANTFFYIGPKGDYRVKNFTVEFRVKFLTEGVQERTWLGISLRKKAQVHYTGTNNLLFVIQRYVDTNQITAHNYAIFDGGEPTDLNNMRDLYGDKLALTSSTYAVPGGQAGQDLPWVTYKLVANGNNYKMYVDDFMVSDCTFSATKYDYFGYLSLNCCIANVLIDDFKVTVQDETLPPPIEPLTAPVVTLNEAEKLITWDYVSGASTYKVFVDGQSTVVFNNSYSLENLAPGSHEISVVAISDDTFISLDSPASQTVTYTVAAPDEGKKKGCGGMVGTELAFLLSAAALVLVSAKRK